jgi:hypothetical protein
MSGIALRSVFFTLVLLLAITYVVAICMKMTTDGNELGETYFMTVWVSMRYLLCFAIAPDLVDVVDMFGDLELSLNAILSILFFSAFIFIVTLTLLNMLIGVLCEVIRVVSSVENEKVEINHIKEGLNSLVHSADQNQTGTITAREFVNLLENPLARKFLDEVNIDSVGLVDFAQTLFKKGNSYTYGEIIQLLLDLRSHNPCTVKDVVDLRKWMDGEMQGIVDVVQEVRTLANRSSRRTFNPSFSAARSGHSTKDR